MRFKILLSYDGSAFRGWQIQPKECSVQETLQKALSILAKEEISVTGAGRTDTGVNAVNYCAHFDTESGLEADWLCYKLNAILPKEICVHRVEEADGGFHARFDASSRTYRYFLHGAKDPFIAGRSYRCPYKLDMEAMNRAAGHLLGTHDFSCFEKSGGNNRTSVCTVTRAVWERYTPDHVRMMGFDPMDAPYLMFTISADRFLRNMVRAVTGTLIDVGRGKTSPESMPSLLASHDRCHAGESVPGHALFLVGVEY